MVITGGTSRLPGIDLLAADAMQLDARIGQNPEWVREELRVPEYSTVLGLMHYALTGASAAGEQTESSRGLFRKVARILNLNFS